MPEKHHRRLLLGLRELPLEIERDLLPWSPLVRELKGDSMLVQESFERTTAAPRESDVLR